MISFSQLLHRTIVDKSTALCYGDIINCGIDSGKIALITNVANIAIDKISHIDNAILAQGCQTIAQCTPLLGKKIITTKGTMIGNITDILLTSTMTPRQLITTEHTITMGKVVEVGDVVLCRPTTAPKPPITTAIQYGKCDWLIGRMCNKTIVNYHNEVLIHSGQLITKQHLTQCKKAYKLRELVINTL